MKINGLAIMKKGKMRFLAALLAGIAATQGFACNPGGNSGPGLPSNPKTTDPVDIYTGNEYREIKDLKVWGGVGEHQLVWERWANSRFVNGPTNFGTGHCWRHGYQWEMADAGSSNGKAQLEIVYPDGTDVTFIETTAGSIAKWTTPGGINDVLTGTANGQNITYSLQRQNGWVYHFKKCQDTQTGSFFYLMTDFTDSQLNDYVLSYNTAHQVTAIAEPGGQTLNVNYTTLNINKIDFATVIAIGSTPAPGYNTIPFGTTPAYRYWRYLSPEGGYCRVAEVQFYDTNGVELKGTTFGTTPKDSSTDYTKAFDGGTNTWFESASPNGGFVGMDMGSPVALGSISYCGEKANYYWMNMGQFQGSNQAPATVDVVSSVTTKDGRTITYNYSPYTDATVPYLYQTLTSVTYDDGTQATYTYGQVYPTTRPLVTAFVDPRYELPFTKSRTIYADASADALGTVKSQVNYDTGEPINTIALVNDNKNFPTLMDGNGALNYYTMVGDVMTMQKDALGQTSSTDYDSHKFVTSSTDALGRTVSRTNTKWNNPLTVTNADQSVQTWTRDSLDLPLTYKDELGRITKWTRDSSHRVTKITYPDTTTETFTYNSLGQPLTHKLRNGGVESFGYDSTGLLMSGTDALGKVKSFTYDTAGRLASVTDARNNTTSIQYNARGLVTQITNPDGTIWTNGYDFFGNKTSDTDELGHTTTYAYDTFNRMVGYTDALNRTTQYVFRSNYYFEKPDKVILPSGKTLTNTYDLKDNLTVTTVGYGTADAATTQFGYDAVYNKTSMTDPRGNVWSFHYNNRDRKISASDPLGNTTQWSYDVVGNVLTQTRPDNGVTTNVYDNMNRLTKSTDPKGQLTQFSYDNADNLLSLTDAKSNIYSFTYDLLNRKLSMKYPDNSAESFVYDPVGNMTQYTTRAGQVRNGTFDVRNRETQTTWSDFTPAISRTFDGAGRLLTLVNSASAIGFGYDDANELASETTTLPGQAAATVSYTYDVDGNRATMTTPAGSLVEYAYTNRNQVASITADGPPALATYAYDLAGNRIGRTLENNTATAYQYDIANRLLGVLHTSGGNVLVSSTYALNAVGNRTSRTEQTGTNAPMQDTYGYDAVDQVTGVNYSTSRTVSYSYDYVGNRTSVTDSGTTTSYAVNNLNQYTQVGAQPVLGYDGNGNLNNNYTGWTYTYDAQNRLVNGSAMATGTSGSSTLVTAAFAYDARNRCVSRTINGVTTNLYYDGWNLIEERDASGNLGSLYVHGVASDEMLAKIDGTNAVFYHQDGLGNTVALSDVNGTVIERYTYDAFGAPTIFDANGTPLAASAQGNRFLYTGREWIADLSLYDYRNRVYSAELGRFIQTDPIRADWGTELDPLASQGGLNLYVYVLNDVANMTDSLGLRIRVTNPALIKSWVKAKAVLVANGYKDIICSLEHSNKVYDILEYTSLDRSDNFTGNRNGGDIYWNPNASLTEGEAELTPTAILGHELAHAERWDRDPKGFENDSVPTGDAYDNAEEKRVITGPEATFQTLTGQKVRTSHNQGKFHY